MSWVANILLHVGLDDEHQIATVNAFFEARQGRFVSLEDPSLPEHWYGGPKSLEVILALGVFNFLDIDELVEHLRTIEWNEPECVQLLVCDQEDHHFSVIDLIPDAQSH